MRAAEFLMEAADDIVGNVMAGDYRVAVDRHVFDREQDRKLSRENIVAAINKIAGAKAKIKQLGNGQRFWLHDNTTDVSVGIRVVNLDQKLFLAKTVLGGRSYTDRFPTFEVR
jgi:hypothetical protein